MCDTFVKISPQGTLLAKNSDREPNEAQVIVRIPGARQVSKKVQLTFIEIPQVRETYEVLLSKPFQMWGAEMGVNEHGLAIGNEAVFTKLKFKKDNTGLTGMDMLRLALERCQRASQALELVTELNARYGQDACGGYRDRNLYYHNSFLIADSREAWVLETAGPHWAAEKVQSFRSISNGLTIESEWDLASPGLEDFAMKQGWVKKGEDFNFRKAYSDWFYTYFSKCRLRQSFTTTAGQQHPDLHIATAMKILQSHGDESGDFNPAHSGMDSVCMHASGITTPSQTTGSMIASLPRDAEPGVWLTGTSAPCLSIFKPFWFGGKTLIQEPPYDKAPLWHQHEQLHREVLRNYPRAKALFQEAQQHFQHSLLQEAEKAKPENRDYISAQALERHRQLIDIWARQVKEAHLPQKGFHPLYQLYWHQQNRQALKSFP